MEMRALPPSNSNVYNMYEVVKPFQMQTSKIAPAFGKMGTGTQYYSPFLRANELEGAGFIKKYLNMIPNTIKELKDFLNENCYNNTSYNNTSYSIDGNVIHEGFGLEKWGELFVWFYLERGKRENIDYFRTEEEAVKYAFNKIIKDKYANSYLIKSTSDIDVKDSFLKELNRRVVKFWTDEIPLNGITYRIFVIGCDVNKVDDLR